LNHTRIFPCVIPSTVEESQDSSTPFHSAQNDKY